MATSSAHSNNANARCSASALQALAALVFEQLRGGEDEGREQSPHHHALDGEHELARCEAGDAGADGDDVARPDDGGNGNPRGGRDAKVVGVRNPRRHGSAAFAGEVFIVGDGGHASILVAARDWRSPATIRPRKSTVGCRQSGIHRAKPPAGCGFLDVPRGGTTIACRGTGVTRSGVPSAFECAAGPESGGRPDRRGGRRGTAARRPPRCRALLLAPRSEGT